MKSNQHKQTYTKIEQKQGNLTRGTKCEVRGDGISHYFI